MPIIWIDKVGIPNTVYPNVPFDIKWRESFFVWPFKEYNIISRIFKDDIKIDYSYKLKHWWFWGSKKHILKQSGISSDTEYRIEVGYEE